jgi:thiamine-phosphate pyrophosphorylase
MAASCLLYYITDRTAFPGDEPARRRRLLEKIAEAARVGVDYIQLREKDLPSRELETIARDAVAVIEKLRTENQELRTALLLNSRTDIALAVGADGVHLRSDDVSPRQASAIWRTGHVGTAAPGCRAAQSAAAISELSKRSPLIAVSCHSPEEVSQAAASGATFAVFAPVFEKKDDPSAHATGLVQLREACQHKIPVFALGGITLANARSSLEAGAAGIAAIRLFQENDIGSIAKQLHL